MSSQTFSVSFVFCFGAGRGIQDGSYEYWGHRLKHKRGGKKKEEIRNAERKRDEGEKDEVNCEEEPKVRDI